MTTFLLCHFDGYLFLSSRAQREIFNTLLIAHITYYRFLPLGKLGVEMTKKESRLDDKGKVSEKS